MNSLLTKIHIAHTPIECHIRKGILKSNGVDSFIFDENIIYVDPFSAVAVNGVKLMVANEDLSHAKTILAMANNILALQEQMYKEFDEQQKVLAIQSSIRQNPSSLEEMESLPDGILAREDWNELIEAEKEFQEIKNRRFEFSKEQFWIHVFEGGLIDYFRIRPNCYHLNRDLIETYENNQNEDCQYPCPNCGSGNIRYGYAINEAWDPIYLLLNLLVLAPFPMIRKRYHCYDCDEEFRKKEVRGLTR